MRILRRFLARVLNLGTTLGTGRAQDERLKEEIEGHIALQTEENVRAGLSPAEARRQAILKFGGMEGVKEEYRAERGLPFIETLLQDVRYAMRMLRNNPGFTAVAVFTLALGIGASTGIFSVVDAVLLRALPYPNPERLVRVWEKAPDGHPMNLADPNFDDFVTQNNTFADLAAYEYWLSSVSGGSEPVRVNIASVSRGFFKALGVEPSRGRAFAGDELQVHGAPAAIVSHSYWQRSLGGAADLSKLHLRIEGAVYSVVGVMPEGFDYPPDVAVWIPRELSPELPSRTATTGEVLAASKTA
jgi:hypothetical protein